MTLSLEALGNAQRRPLAFSRSLLFIFVAAFTTLGLRHWGSTFPGFPWAAALGSADDQLLLLAHSHLLLALPLLCAAAAAWLFPHPLMGVVVRAGVRGPAPWWALALALLLSFASAALMWPATGTDDGTGGEIVAFAPMAVAIGLAVAWLPLAAWRRGFRLVGALGAGASVGLAAGAVQLLWALPRQLPDPTANAATPGLPQPSEAADWMGGLTTAFGYFFLTFGLFFAVAARGFLARWLVSATAFLIPLAITRGATLPDFAQLRTTAPSSAVALWAEVLDHSWAFVILGILLLLSAAAGAQVRYISEKTIPNSVILDS